MNMTYSPLGVTFGFRSDLMLESYADFHKYHKKVNHKLQQLRGRLNLISKDTRNYKGQEKLAKVSKEDYNKNRLYGFLTLLLAERDLAFVECIKLSGRNRGHFKNVDLKLMRTRIKRAIQHCQKLLSLVQDEEKWSIVAEIMIYEKLIRTEYELFGRNQVKHTDGQKISSYLSMAFVAVDFLVAKGLLKQELADGIKDRYNYIFKEKANAFTSMDQQRYFAKVISDNQDDELLKLLKAHGFTFNISLDDQTEQSREIQWRSYSATIEDNKVFEVLNELNDLNYSHETDKLAGLNEKLFKWSKSINLQKEHMEKNKDEDNINENDQILLTYLQYNSLFITVQRDNILFEQLCQQWDKLSQKSTSSKLAKYREVEHVIKNLNTLLDQLMDLPGVYSDSDLMNQVFLLKTYYETSFSSQFLAPLYQAKKKYVESLALYVDSLQKLNNAEESVGQWQDIYLPGELLTQERITNLKSSITTAWKSVVVLAEYEKSLQVTGPEKKYQLSLVEKLNFNIYPEDVSLDNLFTMRPQIKPVPAKPTVFDMAFNYFAPNQEQSSNSQPKSSSKPKVEPIGLAESSETPAKKSIFGLFRH